MTPANDNKTNEGVNGRLSHSRLFAVMSAAVVGLTVLAALAVSDPPWVVRDLKRDQDLAGRLNAVQLSIANYHRTENKLPASLADLLASPQTTPFNATTETLKQLDYTPGSDGRSYELCTVFLRDSGSEQMSYIQAWKHHAGRQCFPLKVPEKTSTLDDTYFILPQRP